MFASIVRVALLRTSLDNCLKNKHTLYYLPFRFATPNHLQIPNFHAHRNNMSCPRFVWKEFKNLVLSTIITLSTAMRAKGHVKPEGKKTERRARNTLGVSNIVLDIYLQLSRAAMTQDWERFP